MMECYQCRHGKPSFGGHYACHFPGTKMSPLSFLEVQNIICMKLLNLTLDAHGVQNGWCYWPFNFDPAWVIACNGYEERRNEQ